LICRQSSAGPFEPSPIAPDYLNQPQPEETPDA
jgi:hypothetical protein